MRTTPTYFSCRLASAILLIRFLAFLAFLAFLDLKFRAWYKEFGVMMRDGCVDKSVCPLCLILELR